MPSFLAIDTINGAAVGALSAIQGVGINAMYGLVYRNGYIRALLRLRDSDNHVLPGTSNPILKRFTGIGPLDKVLTLAGVMFCNITDGSSPESSLYGFYFAGQLIPIFSAVVIESLREGNRKSAMSQSVLWGCAMQATGYGFTMPLYAITHLLTSPTAGRPGQSLAEAVRVSDVQLLETLPAAIALGYLVPSVLMSIPLPNLLHQWLGGLWQGFPLWVVLSMRLLKWYKQRHPQKPPQPPQSRGHEMYALHRICSLAFWAAAVCHWVTIGVIGARSALPFLFSRRLREALTAAQVFMPPPFWDPGEIPSMATGILNFFQYDLYVGSIAAFAWVTALNVNVLGRPAQLRGWLNCIWQIVILGCAAGPGGALISLLWSRDENLAEDDKLRDRE